MFKSLEIKEILNDSLGISSSYINIGIFYSIQNNYSKSIKNYRKAVEIRLALHKENMLGNAYNNLGIDYEESNNYDSAKYFYKKGLELRKERGDLKLAKIKLNI